MRFEPDKAEIYHNRALVYFRRGDYKNTVDDETKAIELNPNFTAAYHNRGVAHAREERYDEAIEDYNKALAIVPNYGEAYFSRGVAFVRKGSADFRRACTLGIKVACEDLKQISE